MAIIYIQKNIGETPLVAMERFRSAKGEFQNEPMTYAGRLDPLAEGVLLILTGEDCKKKDDYLGLRKEYIGEILFGFRTDTGDILGLVKDSKNSDLSREMLKEKANSFVGRHVWDYPAYSSKTIDGIPMWALEREGDLSGKEIPKKEIEIYSVDFMDLKEIEKEILWQIIKKDVSAIVGDFRQKEILQNWQNLLENSKQKSFQVLKIKVSVSGGTYVRTLAEKIGESLGVSATLMRLNRTKIG